MASDFLISQLAVTLFYILVGAKALLGVITVGSILRLTEDSLAPVACLEPGAKACEHASECRTLTLWKGLDKVINDYLDNITIADLIHTNPDEYDYII